MPWTSLRIPSAFYRPPPRPRKRRRARQSTVDSQTAVLTTRSVEEGLKREDLLSPGDHRFCSLSGRRTATPVPSIVAHAVRSRCPRPDNSPYMLRSHPAAYHI